METGRGVDRCKSREWMGKGWREEEFSSDVWHRWAEMHGCNTACV